MSLQIVISLCLVGIASAQAPKPAVGSQPTVLSSKSTAGTDQLIVRYRASSTMGAAFARGEAGASKVRDVEMQRLNAQSGAKLSFVRTFDTDAYVVQLDQEVSLDEATKLSRLIAADPSVEYAEPDVRMFPTVVPDDPDYSEQWGYFAPADGVYGANFAGAWDVTTGSLGIVIAVIDTGVLTHADLAGRVLSGYDFIGNVQSANDGDGRDANAIDSGDWVTSAESQQVEGAYYGCGVRNSGWHGTHVAGTIGAVSNNGSGVAGANWVSKILPVRTLGKCGGYSSDTIDGMRWSAGLSVSGVPANPNPAKVLNLSLGGSSSSCSVSYQNAIDDVVAAGAVVVVAAGNSNEWAGLHSPASCDKIITVAATGKAGSRAYYSNYGSVVSGTVVEIAAPGGDLSADSGVGIYSTLNAGLTTAGADSYAHYQGTSMATPHAAGLASLILSVAPNLTPAQVAYVMTSTAQAFPGGSTCTAAACGAGIIDAAAAVNYAASTPFVDAVGGAVIADDGFLPANNAPDPGESIVVSLTIKNNGGAVMPSAFGKLSDGAPVSMGTLGSGIMVRRAFTATVDPALVCSASFTNTLVITDGVHTPVTLTWPLNIGAANVENFDSVTAPALPTGWARTASSTDASAFWRTVTNYADTGANSAWAPNTGFVSDLAFTSAVFTPTAANRVVQFRHKLEIEAYYDGAALEASIAGGVFTDVIAAGGSFETGGYNVIMISGLGNAMGGRMGWSGTANWTTVRLVLPQSAVGKAVQMRWRMASDSFTGYGGYWLDSIQLPGYTCAAPGITVRETTAVSGKRATIVLNKAPTANVTIPMHSSSASVMITPTSMLFTTANWNVAQVLTVTSNAVLTAGVVVIDAATSTDSKYSGMKPLSAPSWAMLSNN
ncbi:MAG: S8 family serine peptidase, partial [Chloroflexi bacterium]|nr:S8 family serine peptidase [Chloroflexota bacterium]